MPNLIRQEGYRYAFDPAACAGCGGRCCTGESGNIFVSPDEIRALASFVGMETEQFRERFLVKRGYRFSLGEKIVGLSHDCIFYDREAGGCSVYDARPRQCRTFPFWDYFRERTDELKRECPGIVDA